MPPRKPSFFGLSGLVAIFLLVVAFLTNLATNYSLQEVQFWVLLVGLVIVVVLLDYAERYVAYLKKQDALVEREKNHWKRVIPILRITLWRIEYLWREIERRAIGSNEILELACLHLSSDKRSWQLLLEHEIANSKHRDSILCGTLWFSKIENRSHDGKPKIIPLNAEIKNEITDAQQKTAFDGVQTALLIPVYDLTQNPAKTPYNIIAVIAVYSTQTVDRSILGTDIVMRDAEKIGEKLDLILSFGYLSGESVV